MRSLLAKWNSINILKKCDDLIKSKPIIISSVWFKDIRQNKKLKKIGYWNTSSIYYAFSPLGMLDIQIEHLIQKKSMASINQHLFYNNQQKAHLKSNWFSCIGRSSQFPFLVFFRLWRFREYGDFNYWQNMVFRAQWKNGKNNKFLQKKWKHLLKEDTF